MEIKSSEQKRQHDSNGSTVHWTATLIRRWWLTLFIPIAVGIVSDTSLLMKYPQAVGLDGYYYVLQADSLRQTGHLLYSSSTPVLFYVLAVVSKITGDTVLAAKAVSIGFHVLLCAGLFVLLRVLSGRSWPGALAGLMAAICGLHVYLIVEFVKSLAALALFVWAVCFWLLAEKRAPSWRTRMVAGLCLVLAMLTHRAMWLVVAGIVLSVLITYLLQRETKKALSLAVLVLVACFLMPWCLASQTAFGLPCQMQTELLSHPATPLDNIGWPEKILVAFFAPAALFVARIYRAQIDPRLLSCLAAVGVLSILVTLNPFLDHGQGSLNVTGRLSNLAYLEAAVLVPGVFFVFARMGQRRILFFLGLASTCFIVLSTRIYLPAGIQQDYMHRRAELLFRLPTARTRMARSPVIVAPHGEEFIATYVLGAQSQHSYPSDGRNVYWILRQVRPGWLTPMLVLAKDDEWSYTVLAENGSLAAALANLNPRAKDYLLHANPQLRPPKLCDPGNHAQQQRTSSPLSPSGTPIASGRAETRPELFGGARYVRSLRR